jgi:UDPglucose 6-dehydrogenase
LTSVGWIGLGRLGAPCAATLSYYGGHIVWGYDVRGPDAHLYDFASLPPIELAESVDRVVTETDEVVFVAVQTPHSPEYGGDQPVPTQPREFEYAYLVNAVRAVCRAALGQRKSITLVVVSTVLPGTFDRLLRPLLNEYITPVYHPFFIAMGTVIEDFARPEMTLFGVDRLGAEDPVVEIYAPLHSAPRPTMSIASAELTKVAYNTFISTKIVFANTLMEMCEHTGADVDDVTGALALGTDRIVSSRYMTAGMGDGGACHPRDNVALSALAQRYELSFDLMGQLTRARENQAGWLADIIEHWTALTDLPLAILGKSYKPDVHLVDGSPALLLASILSDRFVEFDHYGRNVPDVDGAHVFFIATQHSEYLDYKFPAGSVVIDPFGYIASRAEITLVTPGRKR